MTGSISRRYFQDKNIGKISTGTDPGFLERGFIYIKDVGVRFADVISFFLNIPRKWNNLVSLRPNYFIFMGYLKTGRGGGFERTPVTPSGSTTEVRCPLTFDANKQLLSLLSFMVTKYENLFRRKKWERSGSVVECLTRERTAAGSSFIGVTALCPWARHIYPGLVLVQPRKTRPYITERLLMRRKE